MTSVSQPWDSDSDEPVDKPIVINGSVHNTENLDQSDEPMFNTDDEFHDEPLPKSYSQPSDEPMFNTDDDSDDEPLSKIFTQPSVKRTRADQDPDHPLKRLRSAEWVKLIPGTECKDLDDGQKIVFVNGFFDNFPNDAQTEWNNPESAESLCTQYVKWLYPDKVFEVTSSTYSKYIDLWERGGDIYMFKAPGFFYFSNPSTLPEFDTFNPQEYAIDHCMQHGAFRSTTMQVLAFYYTKILPQRFKKNLYIHRIPMVIPHIDALELQEAEQVKAQLRNFLAATPQGAMGIAHISIPQHAMTLIFDSPQRRLELYDSNGVDARYSAVEGGPLQTLNLFDYLKTQERSTLLDFGIKKIWGNMFRFQQQDGSCSLWSSTMAICRMTGIGREQLPMKTQDVKDITSMNRKLMLDACKFRFIVEGQVTFLTLDRMINECEVPKTDADTLLSMVTKHAENNPIPIPPDTPLDLDEKKAEVVCPKPLVINLQQVDVNQYFISYVGWYCERDTVVVRGHSVPDSAAALRLILPNSTHIELEMSEPINLSDVDTVRTLDRVLSEDRRYQILAKEAVVYADNNLDLIKKMRGRLHFDKIVIAKPLSFEANSVFAVISDELVNEPQPWVLTLNLLNVGAVGDVLTLHTNSVDRLICTGPLVGQETPIYWLNSPDRLQLLMLKSEYVEIPSADVSVVVGACDTAKPGHVLHVREVKTSATLADRIRTMELSSWIEKHVVTVDRLVMKLTFGEEVLPQFARAFALQQPQIPIFMAIHPVDAEAQQFATSLGISNFIVDRESRNSNVLRGSVEYRDFYTPKFSGFE